MVWSLHWSCSGNHWELVGVLPLSFLGTCSTNRCPCSLFILSSAILREPLVWGFHWDTAEVVELATVSYFLHFNWFNIIVIVSNCCKRTSFGDDWQPHLSANFTIHFLTSSVNGRTSYLPRALIVKRFSRVPWTLIFLFILCVWSTSGWLPLCSTANTQHSSTTNSWKCLPPLSSQVLESNTTLPTKVPRVHL